jgi:hypothetical protein
MKSQTITFSKSRTIFKCCLAATLIAITVSMAGKIDVQQFIRNILDWDCI